MRRNYARLTSSLASPKRAGSVLGVLVLLVAGVGWSQTGGNRTANGFLSPTGKAGKLIQAVKQKLKPAPLQGPEARVTDAVDETQTVTLGRNTRPEANIANDRGRVADEASFDHILMVLQRSPAQEAALQTLYEQLNDRSSPNFHKWLTPEQFGNRFGVSDQDIAAVTSWLQSNGFHVNRVYPSKMTIDFGGTAASIRKGFHTEIHNLSVNGEAHMANMSDPQIPAALAPVIKGLFALNDFKPHPMYKLATQYTFTGCTGATGTGHCYGVTPTDNQVIYNLYPLYNAGISGQGQTIVLAEDTDTYGTAGSNGASDFNTYRSTFGLSSAFPAGSYSQVHPGGCTDPGTNGDDGEAAIDVEVASAIAPSAAIELISCPSATFTFGGLIAVNNMINQGGTIPSIVSVSYGLCEVLTGPGGNASFNAVYQQAAMEGVSVFSSSGDEGPSSCSNLFSAGAQYDVDSLGITGWGDSQYVVSVGGTDFEDVYNAKEAGVPLSTYWDLTNDSTSGSALKYVPEIPWNDACASVLVSEYLTGSFTAYGASPATCNNSAYDTSSTFLSTGAGSGGASNCYTGNPAGAASSVITAAPCQGYPKPTYQTGAALKGGQAVYGSTNDGVRDIPDVSMFAANGVWGHYEVVCWSDPSQTSGGATPCTGAPSTWAGFGGTSVAAPTMAAVQALVNQKTGTTWGNPDPIYYQIGQDEYGVAGGTFQGGACNASAAGGPSNSCAFHDVTQGDIDLACEYNSTTERAHCYLPTGTHGVDSTDNVTTATMINGGANYTSAPTCTIAGPTNMNPYLSPTNTTLWAGGTQATCTAGTPNAASTTSTWTLAFPSSGGNPTGWAADTLSIVVAGTQYSFVTTASAANQVTIATTSTSTTNRTNSLKNLEAAINANSTQCGTTAPCYGAGTVANPNVTATLSGTTVTITSKTTGYAGNVSVNAGPTFIENPEVFTVTNTVIGQGPNYIPSITISNGGSGYQPETPITLTGGGGSGAIAVANTSNGTGAQSYQPSYGAGSGYDLATGLGTPNATALVNAPEWITNNSNAGIYSPVSGSALPGNAETFYWNAAASATAYWLDLGSAQGGNQYLDSGSLSSSTLSYSVTDLPMDGSTVWARWYYNVGGTWSYNDYSYTAATTTPGGDSAAQITSPTPPGPLSGSSQAFTWSAGTGATLYDLDAGSTPGGTQYYSSGQTTSLGVTATGLPTDGSTVYVTLYSKIQNTFVSNSYTYTASGSATSPAQMTSPTPGTMFSGSSVTFQWTTGTGATAYYLDVGTSGHVNQYYSQNQGTNTMVTVNGLPTDGSSILVTLYSFINNAWQNNQYTYTAFNAQTSASTMVSPTPGSTFSGSSATFTWNAVGGAQAYYLDCGTNANVNLYYSQNQGTNTTVTVNTLPTDGSQVVVTLYTEFGGTWYHNTYNYTAASFTLAAITAPSPGSTLPGPSATFTWNTGSGATAYYLDIGTQSNVNKYYSQNEGTNTSDTVNSLPLDGSTVYVTLYSFLNGSWQSNQYTYTASSLSAITSPAPNSVLSGSSQTFNWSTGGSVTEYWLDVGTTSMGNDLYSQDQGSGLSVTVNGLPTDGSTIYVTIYSKIEGQWYNNGSVSYTTGP